MKKSRELMRVIGVLASLLFVMVFTLLGTGAVQAQSSEVRTVKVGWFSDLTGPLADTQPARLPGGRDYFKYVNEQGGIKGKGGVVKVDVLWVDDKSNPTIALETYEKWRRDPDLVVTSNLLAVVIAALEDKLRTDKIPCVYGAGTVSVVMEPLRDYIYMTGPPRDRQIAAVVDWVLKNWKEKKPPKFAVIGNDQGWAKHCVYNGGGAKYAQARGLEVVRLIVPLFPTDTTSELRKIKEAGVNFIYSVISPMTASILLKDAYRVGLNIPIILDQACGDYDVVVKLKEAGEGIYITPAAMPFHNVAEQFMTPGLRKVTEIYAKYNPQKTPAHITYSYGFRDALIISEGIRLALEKVSAKELNGEALKKYGFGAMKDFDPMSLTGPITFPPDTHIGQNSVVLVQLKGGKVHVPLNWTEAPFVTETRLLKSPYLKPGKWEELIK
jgi:branched-chain amino acid transport system substrate-binding protein